MIDSIIPGIADFLFLFFRLILPFLALCFIGFKFKAFLQARFKWAFFASSFLSVCVILFILLLIAFFAPWLSALGEEDLGVVPDFAQVSSIDLIQLALFNFFRLLFVSIVLSLLLMPFAFIGSFLMSYFDSKKKSFLLSFVISSSIILILFLILWLFFMPWLSLAVLYLIFFA